MASGQWSAASESGGSGERRAALGGCEEGERERSEPTPEVSQGRIVGHDSIRVIDDSTNDKIGILSHEGMDAADPSTATMQHATVRPVQSFSGGSVLP